MSENALEPTGVSFPVAPGGAEWGGGFSCRGQALCGLSSHWHRGKDHVGSPITLPRFGADGKLGGGIWKSSAAKRQKWSQTASHRHAGDLGDEDISTRCLPPAASL